MALAMSNAMGGQAAMYRCDPTESEIGRATKYYEEKDRLITSSSLSSSSSSYIVQLINEDVIDILPVILQRVPLKCESFESYPTENPEIFDDISMLRQQYIQAHRQNPYTAESLSQQQSLLHHTWTLNAVFLPFLRDTWTLNAVFLPFLREHTYVERTDYTISGAIVIISQAQFKFFFLFLLFFE